MARARIISLAIVVLILAVVLTGCAPGTGRFGPEEPAGFWAGLWHGAISIVTLIISFFSRGVRMYECYNRGPLYDLGFFLGVVIVWGGLFHGHKRHSRRCRSTESSGA
jgi:hypothetical protein